MKDKLTWIVAFIVFAVLAFFIAEPGALIGFDGSRKGSSPSAATDASTPNGNSRTNSITLSHFPEKRVMVAEEAFGTASGTGNIIIFILNQRNQYARDAYRHDLTSLANLK